MKRNFMLFGYVLIHFFTISLLAGDDKERVYGLRDLAALSDFIVKGKVVRIETYENQTGRRYSDVYFHITACYKNNSIEGQNIVLTIFGGTIGRSVVMTTVHPQFKENQESILFLKRYLPKDQMKYQFYVIGLAQGKFNIIKENGQEFLLRDRFASAGLKILRNNVVSELSNSSKIPLSDFLGNLYSFVN